MVIKGISGYCSNSIMHRISVEMMIISLRMQVPGIPAVCTVCQVPAEFPDPDNPTKLWTQYSEYNNKTYMTCSPGCKYIFEQEPYKYSQMWWPSEAYLSGEFGEDPIAGMFKYTGFIS